MFVTKIYQAAMSRQNLQRSERKPFFLYVDEFQNFATDTFGEILSEARKYGL
jgi:type IV secretory pathway TraG/TraD family ATPase VirD4